MTTMNELVWCISERKDVGPYTCAVTPVGSNSNVTAIAYVNCKYNIYIGKNSYSQLACSYSVFQKPPPWTV